MIKLFARLASLLIICAIITACVQAYKTAAICPDCSESNCIYQEINNTVKCDADSCIMDAVKEVCNRRKITDSSTVKNILSNYYL